jgi:hypothetical protein
MLHKHCRASRRLLVLDFLLFYHLFIFLLFALRLGFMGLAHGVGHGIANGVDHEDT